ncbi:MAG TPA: S8 family serine peptidase, partial [Solirubrobacteraceae bacterium]|nr:S8 family serine peptidase [Solirubrobacteraceae bacterium]
RRYGARVRRAVLVSVAVAGLLPVAQATAAAPRTGRLVVTLAPSATASTRAQGAAVAATAGARRPGSAVPRLHAVAVRPRPGETLRALRARLLRDPRVEHADVEHRARPRFVPNDPALRQEETANGTAPGTIVEWWAARTGLPAAWDLQRGDSALVAVIDTGVDASHPDLAGRIAAAADFSGEGPATQDPVGHGTHVASLACAAGDNGIGLAGAGLGCRLLVARTDFTDTSVASAIVWATDRGADAITMSFGTAPGTAPSRVVTGALDYAYAHGVVLAAAAADEPAQDQGYPASVLQPTGTGPSPGAGKGLSVTAADASDDRASFAGYGSQISLAAYGAYAQKDGPRGIFGAFTGTTPSQLERPGLDTLPPRKPCLCRTIFDDDPRYAYLQGTSMAAPVVAAVGALVRRMNPDLGIAEVLQVLKSSARRPAGRWTADLGWGILDAGAAVRAAAAIDRRPPSSRLRASARRTHRRTVLLRWRGSDSGPPGVAVSGIARYEVWRSVDGHSWRRILVASKRRLRMRVRVRPRSRYRFLTVAVDAAGNREPLARRADARVVALRPRST